MRPPTIFLSAAEPSADRIGADLIRAVRTIRPAARFVAVAGPRMVQAGCESIFDMSSHAAMLLGVVKSAARGWAMLRTATAWLKAHRPDVVIVIDSPTLHLPLARRAKKLGLPVMYYVAPQLWAWGAWRVRKLRRRVDHVAAILPFEEPYFRERGVPTTFVGHPLGDAMAAEAMDETEAARLRSLGSPLVALLPGSRAHVVEALAADQLRIAERIREAFPKAAFAMSAANEKSAGIVRAAVASTGMPVEIIEGPLGNLLRAADLVLVASGTTTLEAAMHARPMIVMYKASRLAYQLAGRWMIRTKYLSLPNILAGREIVPEFMPYYTSTEPIAAKAVALLNAPPMASEMTGALSQVVEPLRKPGASQRAAELALKLIAGPACTDRQAARA